MSAVKGGPWTGERGAWTLTTDEVHQVLVAAPDRVAMARAIKDTYGSRKMDRALQLLRKAGLLAYDPPSREWRRTAAGDKAQATA